MKDINLGPLLGINLISIQQTNNKNTNTTASTNLQFQCNLYWLSLKTFSGHPRNDYYFQTWFAPSSSDYPLT